MPPSAVKTIQDLIYWQYAKIISGSAGFGKKNYGFIMDRFKKLQSGEIEWSGAIREYLKEKEKHDQCIYCGTEGKLTHEHILPTCRGGPDCADNAVMVCQKCNSSKGGKRLYEWLGVDNKDNGNRIAEGKYLKLLYALHEKNGTLSRGIMCGECDLEEKCPEKERLTVYCLEGCFKKMSN